MIKSIIFDCYGTLIDTGDGSVRATKQILAKYDSGVSPEQVYKEWKRLHHQICAEEPFKTEAYAFLMSLEMLYKMYGIDGDPGRDVTIMLDTLGKRAIFPEVQEVLQTLSQKVMLVVGSNSDHEPLLADLTRNNVTMQHVFSSECLGVYKPNGQFFIKILDHISLKPEEVVYVGDSQIDDIKGPAEAGIRSIWINRKNEPLAEGIPQPAIECKDLTGVLSVNGRYGLL